MKKPADPAPGKILNHSQDQGLPSPGDIERRAREIARIEAHAPSREDRQQAERELAGGDLPPTTDDDAESVGGLSRDPSEPVSIPGRQIPDREDESGQSTVERLVADGVNEAEHEQMLAARRRKKP